MLSINELLKQQKQLNPIFAQALVDLDNPENYPLTLDFGSLRVTFKSPEQFTPLWRKLPFKIHLEGNYA